MVDINKLREKGWRSDMIDDIAAEYRLSDEEKEIVKNKLYEFEQQEHVSCLDCDNIIIKNEEDIQCPYEDKCYFYDFEDTTARSMRPCFKQSSKIELGNLFFGHSRGNFPIEPRRAMEEIFFDFFDQLNLDTYGYPDNNKLINGLSENTVKDSYGFGNDVFEIRPYYWGDNDEVFQLPNFIYKPENIEIRWYKYPFRDSYSNVQLNTVKLRVICDKCKESLSLS